MKDQTNIIVRLANWPAEKSLLRTIREQVFVEEQKVPREIEWDDLDDQSQHFLAFNQQTEAIACARVLPSGQFGRMAVIKSWRNKGVGRQVLDAIIAYAQANQLCLHCHAQVQAIPFYENAGFIGVGERYMEAGIEHQNMKYKP